MLSLTFFSTSFAMDAGKIYEKSIKSVVTIVSLDKNNKIKMTGTGFYIKNTQLIATNYHVINGAKRLKFITSTEDEHDIFDICSKNEANDIAILRSTIDKQHLSFSNSMPKVGEEIAAIGSPMGLPGSLSTGIIGAIRKKEGQTLYQITSPISPGSSGGPIINEKGYVIGMSTFYIKGAQNLNFAIPSTQIAKSLSNTDKCFDKVNAKPSEDTINKYADAFLNYYTNNKQSFPDNTNINKTSILCAAKLIGDFATDEEMLALASVFTNKNSKLEFSTYRDTALKTLINYTSRNECLARK